MEKNQRDQKTTGGKNHAPLSFMMIALAVMFGVLILSIQSYYHAEKNKTRAEESVQGASIQKLSVLDLKEMIDRGDKFFLIDTRSKKEFSNGHIEKAISIQPDEIELKHPQLLPPDNLLVLACESGTCGTNNEAARKLRDLGFTNIAYLDGGTNLWQDFGYPLTSASGRTADNLFSVSVSELEAKISNSARLEIIDVRPRDEFLRGHIDGARNIPIDEINSQYETISQDGDVILYSNQADLSSLVFKNLAEKGFTNLFILEGGFNAWLSAGNPSR